MDLLLCRSLWGLEDDPDRFVDALADVAAGGYDAVSCPVQLVPDHHAFAEALERHDLTYVPQVFTFGSTVEDHLGMLADALALAASFDPPHVLAQAGRDSWNHETARRFLDGARRIASEHGIVVAHETHRGRLLCNPWTTERLLEQHPDLAISADLSHWVCVAERLNIGRGAVEAVARRAAHIDARVGFEQGPQVSDPDAERYAAHVETFDGWWDQIWDTQAENRSVLSITPEYGPPPYQPLETDGRPARPLAEIVDQAAGRIRTRYATRVVVPC